MKKKLLFIVSEYPPEESPTTLAASFVIEQAKQKYEVFCLAVHGDGSKRKKDDHVFYLRSKLWKKFPRLVRRVIMRVNQMITIPFYPVCSPILQYQLNRKALQICKKNEIDCVVGVSFPFESIVAASYVKKKWNKIKFIPYMIDAYACGTMPKYLSYDYALKRRHRYEMKNIIGADQIVAMEASKAYHEKNSGAAYEKMIFLNPAFLNRTEETRFSVCEKNEKIKEYIDIVYAGYLYLPDRDPTYIIRLLSNSNIHTKVRLIFVGPSTVDQIIEKEKMNFPGEIIVLGKRPHNELKQILENADVFLHLGVSNNNAISGKIFEYMAYGKPILAVYFSEQEATLPYLNKYPLACCIKQNFQNINETAMALDEFLKKTENKTLEYCNVKQMFYTSTPEAFLDVLDQSLGEKNENRNSI